MATTGRSVVSAKGRLPYAGFGLRFLAGLVDGVIGMLVLAVIAFDVVTGVEVLQWMVGGESLVFFEFWRGPNADVVGFLSYMVLAVGFSLYFIVQESSAEQATLGMRIVGLKVCDEEGKRISFWRAAGRLYGQYLSVVPLFAGYFMILWTRRRQGLHDMAARTLVVRV